jgi:hypothetical protein
MRQLRGVGGGSEIEQASDLDYWNGVCLYREIDQDGKLNFSAQEQ